METSNAANALPAGPVRVTRRVHFCAAHRLHVDTEGSEWNAETFGDCNNPMWHGHNYELEVSVLGEPDPVTGYLIDLKELKNIIQDKILGPCDHRNLNEQVAFLKGINPTSENLVKAFWKELEPSINTSKRKLCHIKLYETPRNIAEYAGPEGF